MSNGIGHVWAVNAEGGDQGRPNGVGPVWIENADQLGTKLPEPESGDAGKVLGVLNSDGDIGWVPDQEGMAQVQADWDQADSSQVSYIANKPSLATVATSGAYSDLSGTPTIPTVDQEYNSASANAQSGVAVAGAISGKQDTINDLETIRSGAAAGATAVQPGSLATVATTGSYADLSNKPTIPTVDQNYNASSTNAQSGTAVAQAIASIPSASYTAGDGIDITANEVSVKAGTGLEIGTSSGTVTAQTVGLTQHVISSNIDTVYVVQPLTPEIFAAISNNAATVTLSTIPVTDPEYTNWHIADSQGATAYVVIGKIKEISLPNSSGWEFDSSKVMFLGVAVQTIDASGDVPTNVAYNVHASDNTDADSTLTWSELATALAGGTISDYAIFIAIKYESFLGMTPKAAYCSHITGVVDCQIATGSITYTATVANALKVSNPVPAYAAGDAGKVLKVNASGNAEWDTVSIPTYTAGNGIAITSGTISAKVGGGIKFGTAAVPSTTTEQLYMTADDMSNCVYGFGSVSNSATALNNGDTVSVELNYNFTVTTSPGISGTYYAAIAQFDNKWGSTMDGEPYLIFGEVTPSEAFGSEVYFDEGFSVDYNINDISTSLSNNLTWSTVQANPGSYQFGIIYIDTQDAYAVKYPDTSYSYEPLNTATATIPTTVNVPNSIVLEHPIELVQSLPASPDTNTLYLIPEA